MTDSGPTEDAGGEPFRLRSVAVAAYGPTILEAIGYGAAVPVVPLLARDLGASVGMAALTAALLGVGQVATSLPAGTFIERCGERRAMLIAAAAGAIAMAAAGSARQLVVLALAVTVIGMTWSVFLLARQGFMIDAVPVAMRARALSTLGGSHRVGLFAGPLIAAPVIAHWGMRAAFVIGVAAAGLASALIIRVPDLGGSARAAAREQPATIGQVLRAHRHTLATVGAAATTLSALRGIRLSVLPLWCDHVGLEPAQVSVLFAIAAAVEIGLFYPAGWVMDRYGRAFVAVPTAVVLGSGLALLPLTGAFASVLVVAVVMAIGNGLGSGIVMTLGADTAPVVHRAKYLGGWRLCGDLGFSGGPLLVSGLTGLISLAATSVTVGVAGVLAGGWVLRVVHRLDRARASGSRGGSSDLPG
ncbi:MAG: MFS transporter [Tetrasphaera sp.]